MIDSYIKYKIAWSRAAARTSPEGSAKAVDTSVSQPIGKAEVSRLEPHHSEPPKASNLPAADIPKSISAPQGFDTHVGSWKRRTFLVVAARLRKGDFGGN